MMWEKLNAKGDVSGGAGGRGSWGKAFWGGYSWKMGLERENCYGKRLTGVIQMLAQLHVAMSPRCDVEVALHLVPLQASINPTTRRWHAPSPPGRFLESSLLLAVSQYMPHMGIFLLLLREVLALSI